LQALEARIRSSHRRLSDLV